MKLLLINIVVIVMLIIPDHIYAQTCFPVTDNPTSSSASFWGQATINGVPASSGDKIIAFDSQGNVAGISDILMSGGIAYINLFIYGDDFSTNSIDEGMGSNDPYFTLSLYDVSESICLTYPNEANPQQFTGWFNYNGAPIPAYSNYNAVFDFKGRNQFDLTVLLEGPLEVGATMNTNLTDGGYLPLNQPYNTAPWQYKGTQTLTTIPSNTTDWVLVSIKSNIHNASAIDTLAALLQSDGKIVDTDGGLISFDADLSSYDSVFVAVHHRNHLAIITAIAIPLSNVITIDFRNEVIYGGPNSTKNVSGLQVLWTGDASSNGVIDAFDRSKTWNDKNSSGYLNADSDFNNLVDAGDRSKVWNNRNKQSFLP